ncbi:hypothetical protein SAMN06265360_12438 [Haloechinothrix alba]|uniref:Uncharacterized protein n=1 Tax=Haloechinothrix alba TaxID=664784 RepID=A0A238ZTJ9_9PSEU|nr:hypothetical protein [Haloechinothrix alba]SNR86074.1 hypothetical protein SAMN06265360_12438 [Haloechinothrix alba]
MSWEAQRQRTRTIGRVLDDVHRSGSSRIPANWREPITCIFGSEGTFLVTLLYRWFNEFVQRVDETVRHGCEDSERAAYMVRTQLAAERPALHRVLTAHAEHPALRAARADCAIRLSSGVRLALDGPPAATATAA